MDQPRFGIERRLEFDAGHRLLRHSGKCKNPHGHRYVVLVGMSAPSLDNVGVVEDFGVIKAKLGAWLDEHWDHTMIFQAGDPLISAMYGVAEHEDESPIINDEYEGRFHPHPPCPCQGGKPCYILPCAPSSENLARYLYEAIATPMFAHLEPRGVLVDYIKLYETPNCVAQFPAPARS